MHTQRDWRQGDVVRLNSGSPPLRVLAVTPHELTVGWSNERGQQELTAPAACFSRDVRSTGELAA